ncbi:histone acetylation protein-domain-containing protein [Kockiozyma suomiensis]|uniref:histone acetylation protein-domain-containing protein n=1 Tax=Kockiozyma suomiensis TaxID=1337062 RepID=UPI003343CAD7
MDNSDASRTFASVWNRHLSNALPRIPSQPEHKSSEQQPFVLHHLSAKPKKQALTESSSTSDTLTTHLLMLGYDGVYILALELLVYRSAFYTTLFVSKADSTGFLKLNIRLVITSILRTFILSISRKDIPTRICLFARAQPQYIFPDSGTNGFKHVLTDRQLTEWWIRALDSLLCIFNNPKARLHIPGAEKGDIKYVLRKVSSAWSAGHIFDANLTELAVNKIPNFPDDPKSRFIDSISAENRDSDTSVSQFFDELQMRQEFRLGFVVGIIGVEGIIANPTDLELQGAIVESKIYTRIHDAIVTGHYGNLKDARNATAAVYKVMPEGAMFEIKGSLENDKESKKVEAKKEPVVNVIGGMMVRKRAKPSHVSVSEEFKKAKTEV